MFPDGWKTSEAGSKLLQLLLPEKLLICSAGGGAQENLVVYLS